MIRLIDADLLRVEVGALITIKGSLTPNELRKLIDHQPHYGLVTCKDCKNWETEWEPAGGGHFCPMLDLNTGADFYCSYGERRER